MMIEVYSVYDKAVNAFMAPFFARARGEALRNFIAAVHQENGPFKDNLPDYTLYYLGKFDDASGALIPENAPDKCLSAAEAGNNQLANDPRPNLKNVLG